jgi:hypothetical protein
VNAEDLDARHAEARRVLLAIPGVTGVGVGRKETGGAVTAATAWRVYVQRKLPRACVPAARLVPACAAGLATDVLEQPVGVPAVALGAPISTLRGVVEGEAPIGLGTLGFHALRNGRREREVVLVSNRHVLLAHGARRGDSVHQPLRCERGWVVRRDPIGEIVDEGAEANQAFGYPGEPRSEYFVDCAAARLTVAPERPIVRRVARAHALDVAGARRLLVRKLGGATGVTAGEVLDVAAPVDAAGGPRRLNNLLIRGLGSPWVEAGDSGALVVNERDEAIALLWGRSDRDASIAFACHIHPVLDRLDVTMLTRGHG